ncbi:MAG: DUF6580 family putative transport protein [Planctomycetota bacterium]
MKHGVLQRMARTPVPLVIFIGLLGVGMAGRLVPHPPNFTPVAAAALFAGFYFSKRLVAAVVPMAILGLSDLIIGTYNLPVMLAVYGAFLFPLIFRRWLRAKLSAVRVGTGALCGSAVFFVTTNVAVWLFGGWYPSTPGGLAQCFLAAVPFFKNTLAGDLVWSAVFFGGYALALELQRRSSLRSAPAHAPAAGA